MEGTKAVTEDWVGAEGRNHVHNMTESDINSMCLNQTNLQTFGAATPLTTVVYRGIIPAICLIGILGNILNLAVLTHRSWKHMGRLEVFAKTGLVALATADMCVCLSALPWCFIYYKKVSTSLSFRIIYTTYSPFLINTFMLTSTLFTVSLAVGRYVAISWPIQMRSRINQTFTRTLIAGVLITSIVINLPYLWKMKLNSCTRGDGVTYYYVSKGYMYERKPHLIYSCVYFTIAIALPVVVLGFCNFFLIKNMHRSRRQRLQTARCGSSMRRRQAESQHVMTLVLVIIVLMHIILVTPGGITNFVTKFTADSQSQTRAIIVAVVNVMEICSYTLNFLLYCTLNAHFRLVISRTVLRLCVLCGCRKQTAKNHGDLMNSSVQEEGVTLYSHVS